MAIQQCSILVSNHLNWELGYKDSQTPKQTYLNLNMLARLIGTTVAWPIFFLCGALTLPFQTFNYFKYRWNQHRIITILSNPKRLQDYLVKRIQVCEKQIENLKSNAMFLMEKGLKKPEAVGLAIPQKKGLKDCLLFKLSKHYWKDFSWKEFANTDFFQQSKVPSDIDKHALRRLEQIRTKINFLSQQKFILSKPQGKLEAIKKIAEMSFVKNAFRRQKSKEWMVHSIFWLFPSGVLWDSCFNYPTNERLIYEGNKNFLPSETALQTYDDLVDAHNKLIKNNNFVVPYIVHTIV